MITYVFFYCKGLFLRKNLERPPLSEAHKLQRYEFALEHINDDPDYWVFGDETRAQSHRSKLYRMRKKSRYPKKVAIYKPDRVRLNIWGAISARGGCKFAVS